jgi:hypothetical protein
VVVSCVAGVNRRWIGPIRCDNTRRFFYPLAFMLCGCVMQGRKTARGGVLVCLIPLGVEQSWQGD